uniref:MSP domain-containing protein n=1 Tax=Kwoniella dejecticola CBS 10117 TaxID=1296121 RepID=A0A1A6AEY3_9TREE|nr:MSP domain-containing protein [Kwoniella dejecticola CBS 10117]OBR88609.1 MSP domain-containing protein [Kwoniella dejecticola CBS 10117]
MSVELSPANQLGFPRPLTSLVKRSLFIHNPNPRPVAFKVKTTAPKQYCVRPNSGRVESGESVEVQVLLQPLAQEPPPHAKCKDKFLVQSAYITPDEEMHTLGEMWSQVEKTNKSAIQEQKIKVIYLPAEDGSTNQNGIPEEDDHAGEASRLEESAIFSHAQSSPSQPLPPAQDKPIPVPVQVSPPSTAKAVNGPTSPPLPDLTPGQAGATNAALEQSLHATTSASDKLAVAMKEIDRLRAELEEAKNGPQVTGLRKRGNASGASGTGADTLVEKAKDAVASTSATAGGNQGVPLEVVAGLVVGVFVLTYLFF